MRDRTSARIVGILFIVASVTAVGGGSLLLATVGDDYLTEAPKHANLIVTGALLEMILAVSVIGISAMLFPILRRRNEGMALLFVGVRTLEAVFILAGVLASLAILTLTQNLDSSGTSGVEAVGDTLVSIYEWSYWLGPSLAFSLSALILYPILFRADLVPSWLSSWGLVGAMMFLIRTVMEMYGHEFSIALGAVLTAPIGLNEMVLAGYLIVKGFKPPLVDPQRVIGEG